MDNKSWTKHLDARLLGLDPSTKITVEDDGSVWTSAGRLLAGPVVGIGPLDVLDHVQAYVFSLDNENKLTVEAPASWVLPCSEGVDREKPEARCGWFTAESTTWVDAGGVKTRGNAARPICDDCQKYLVGLPEQQANAEVAA